MGLRYKGSREENSLHGDFLLAEQSAVFHATAGADAVAKGVV